MNSVTLLLVSVFAVGMVLVIGLSLWSWRKLRSQPPKEKNR